MQTRCRSEEQAEQAHTFSDIFHADVHSQFSENTSPLRPQAASDDEVQSAHVTVDNIAFRTPLGKVADQTFPKSSSIGSGLSKVADSVTETALASFLSEKHPGRLGTRHSSSGFTHPSTRSFHPLATTVPSGRTIMRSLISEPSNRSTTLSMLVLSQALYEPFKPASFATLVHLMSAPSTPDVPLSRRSPSYRELVTNISRTAIGPLHPSL